MKNISKPPIIDGHEFNVRISRWTEISPDAEDIFGVDVSIIFLPKDYMLSEFFNSGMLNIYSLQRTIDGLLNSNVVHSVEGPSIIPAGVDYCKVTYPNDEEYFIKHNQEIERKTMIDITRYLLEVVSSIDVNMP